MLLGTTGAATLLLFLAFNLPNNLPNHHVATLPGMEKLQKQLNQADAKLADEQTRFKTGAATSWDVRLAKDQKEFLEAERRFELQAPGYGDGQVPFQAYSQELQSTVSAKRHLQLDEDEAQKSDPQRAAASNTVSFTVTAAGAPPLAYQWYYNGANTAGAPQQVSATRAVNPSGTWNTYVQTDSVQTATSNTGNPNGAWYLHVPTNGSSPSNGWNLHIQTAITTSNAQPAVNIHERVDISDSSDFSKSFTVEPAVSCP